jgi:hypothetical protein
VFILKLIAVCALRCAVSTVCGAGVAVAQQRERDSAAVDDGNGGLEALGAALGERGLRGFSAASGVRVRTVNGGIGGEGR